MDENYFATLCDTCQSFLPIEQWIDRKNQGSRTRHTLHSSQESIRRSIEQGCIYCTELTHLGSDVKELNRVYVEFGFDYTVHFYVILYVDYTDLPRVPSPTSLVISVTLEESVDNITRDLAYASEGTDYTGDENNAQLANQWLLNCLKWHEGCQSNRHPDWYPRRLLDLSERQLRLIDTEIEKPEGPYATVSHVWGIDPFLMLNIENISTFETGVAIGDFPLTFQHLILTARRLQLQYLWIDCYCIFQDDAEDKKREVSTMDQVYSNTLLNFGATAASSPYDGCFAHREPIASTRLPYSSASDGDAKLYRVATNGTMRKHIFFHGEHELFRRAWVVQERLLCPRMLHFGKSQLYWECEGIGSSLASEIFPSGVPYSNLLPFSWKDSRHCRRPHSGYGKDEPIWEKVLNTYTKGNLSRPTEDKFAAIGSIAKRLASPQTGQYLAGFFRNEIKDQLCWFCSRTGNRRAKSWRAPSWSWASIDGEINFPYRSPMSVQHEYLFSINHIDIELDDRRNEYGALRSASLIVTARPLEASLDSKVEYGHRRPILLVDDGEIDFSGFDDADESRDNLFIILLTQLDPRMIGFGDPKEHALIEISGLVLHRLESGSFRRVGMMDGGRVSSEAVDKWLQREEEVITII